MPSAAWLSSLSACADAESPAQRAASIAAGLRDIVACACATVLLFEDDGLLTESDPPGGGFALRDGSAKLRKLFVHALGKFAVPGGAFVPRAQRRALAGVIAGAPAIGDLLFLEMRWDDDLLGYAVIEGEALTDEAMRTTLRGYLDVATRLIGAARRVVAATRRSREGHVLALIDERMQSSLEPARLLEAVASAMRESFAAARCVILRRPDDDHAFVSCVTVSQDEGLSPWPSRVPMDSLLRRVLGGAMVRRDQLEPAGLDALLSTQGIASAIMVPLVTEGHIEHVLDLQFVRERGMADTDVAALRSAAVHAGLALTNARLYERERSGRGRAEALERVVRILRDTQYVDEVLLVFVVTVSHELPVDGAAYAIEGDRLVRRAVRMRNIGGFSPVERIRLDGLMPFLSVEEPSEARLLPREDRVAVFADRTGVVVPLRVEGSLWGMLALTYDQEAFDVSAAERGTFFRTLGSHLELALANARAFERELRRGQERATLAEAARTILSHTQRTPLADAMCRLAATLVDAHRAVALTVTDGLIERIGSFGDDLDRLAATLPPELRGPSVAATNVTSVERRVQRLIEGDGFAVIPLVRSPAEGKREFAGAYLIVGKDGERRFSRDELRLLQELGILFALAVRNLDLFEATSHANAALRESSQFKDDLIAMLAHDFRGPLTVILGYCELLLEEDTDRREEIETIAMQTQRLVRLSDDALILARTQAEGFSLDRSIVDLGDFVALAVESFGREAERIELELPHERLPVSIDPSRFRHVLDNLFSNALKYSTDGVNVSLLREADRVLLRVTDHGIGIPAGEMEGLFTRFGRASNAKRLGIAGTGIGLYTARKVVDVHGGTITVTSKEQEGSTFTVSLPLCASESLPSLPRPA
ncbi:MAG: sensor histidine kinase [Vulcanimicrobiaceae bacterium]